MFTISDFIFEFLIINDGSNDSTKKILEKYSKIDPRIKLIHQSKRGLTASLNYGVKIAGFCPKPKNKSPKTKKNRPQPKTFRPKPKEIRPKQKKKTVFNNKTMQHEPKTIQNEPNTVRKRLENNCKTLGQRPKKRYV